MKVSQLLEGMSKGQQVLAFTNYLDGGHAAKKHLDKFEKLGGVLFNAGYMFDVSPSPRFYHAQEHLTVTLPFARAGQKPQQPTARSGVELVYSTRKDGRLVLAMDFMRADVLLDIGINEALNRLKKRAYPLESGLGP